MDIFSRCPLPRWSHPVQWLWIKSILYNSKLICCPWPSPQPQLFDISTSSLNRCFKLSLAITNSYLSLQSPLLLKSYPFQWRASLLTQWLRSNTVESVYAPFSQIPSSNPIRPNSNFYWLQLHNRSLLTISTITPPWDTSSLSYN